MNEYEIIKFKNDDIELSVNVSPSEDTVWLTKEQIAILFNRDRSVISRHIKNIYDEGELNKSTSVHFLHIRDNNPKKLFRIRANKILKEYFLKGYVINDKSWIKILRII